MKKRLFGLLLLFLLIALPFAVPLAESGIKAADIQLLARVLGNSVSNSQLAYSNNHQSEKFSKTKAHHSNNQLFKISTPAESFPK